MDFATQNHAAEPQGPQSPSPRRATPQPAPPSAQAADGQQRHEVRLRLPPFYILHMEQAQGSHKLS
jgi:hypothetical protein